MDENNAANKATSRQDLLEKTSEILAAYVAHNVVPAEELPALIQRTYAALNMAGRGDVVEAEPPQKPAIPVRRSIGPDYLVCLEDGRKLKMLKRYLRINYDMSPEQYRAKWNLSADYPMVAPNYAKMRAEMARSIGLGRKGRQTRGGNQDGS